MAYKITIDGPAGTGKGTLARNIASEFNITNVDSGALYRSLGLYAIRNSLNVEDEAVIESALKNINIELKEINKGEALKPHIDGEDVSMYIRTEEVAKVTSTLAKYKCVREYMAEKQRAVAENRNIVMEGRDIGSVVFPNAELKIFLTATVEERAKRRYNEMIEKGIDVSYEQVREKIINRDLSDSSRKISPLVQTEDMVKIDSTNMTKEEVMDTVRELIKRRLV